LNRRDAVLAVSAGLGLTLISERPAWGQTAPLATVNDVIIVTAQRREERPEDVPISLTAVSGDQLDRMQATDMRSLGNVVPSLVMTRSGAFTQPYLRGVGKRSTLGVENSVATYVDGVYLASSISALLDLRGIERVEVLNGPQGTLFGRNTTGGVIQVVTKDPDARETGEVMVQAGTYGQVRGDAYVSGGSERLAGNLALSVARHGGFGENRFTGKEDQGEVDHSIVARSKWIWRPGDTLKLTLAGDYQDIDQDFSQRPVKGLTPIGAPGLESFRDGNQDGSNRYHFRYGGASLKAEVEIGGLRFMSLTAARRLHADYNADLDLGPKPLLEGAPTARQSQFSQEFQLQSSGSARLRWVAGLYFIGLKEQYRPTLFRYGGSYSAGLGGRILQTLSDTGKVSSYAAYGQATYPIGQASQLTAGLRYTIEHRSVSAHGERIFDNAPFVRPIPGLPLLSEKPLKNSETFSELTWRASFDHRFSNRLMAYVSASRGFQSGGWNLQTPQSAAFDPERLDSYEAGLKFGDRSGRVKADAAAFVYDYSDMQLSVFTPLGSATTNATSANLYGLDVQLSARLDQATDITLGAQLLHARFNEFRSATCTDYSPEAPTILPPISCDATGNRLPFAPRLKINVGAGHRFELGGRGRLLVNGNLSYNSGYFSEPDNVIRQKAFATIDASVEWQPSRSALAVRLWALNLTDTQHYDSLTVFPTAAALYRPAAPRRLGVSLISSF
jgi:outer membrane receptor protein involved in Fe transport